jgi:two-component system, OmpR family, response regulator
MSPATESPERSGSSPGSHFDDHPNESVALYSLALDEIRETAHTIEDRTRNVLNPHGPSIAQLKFLVVDDYPDAADSLVVVLELFGCSARACYDGWSALNAIGQHPPDVCLLDLMMPDMGGLELAARLKVWAEDRPLLLIATTALADEQSRARSRMAGFHAHLTKPVDPMNLIAAITYLWKVVNQGKGDSHDDFTPHRPV